MPDFWTIVGYIFRFVLQYCLYWIPLLRTLPVGRDPPFSWWYYNTWWDWHGHIDSETRPDEHWIRQWGEMAFGSFKEHVLRAAEPYVNAARDWLYGLIGYVRSGYWSIGHWLSTVEGRLGTYLPWWTATIAAGLDWLRYKLPISIRDGWQSWTQLFDAIKATVWQWVLDRYEQARGWADSAIHWVWGTGAMLAHWYNRVVAWLDNFIANPYGAVTGWLGTAWSWLVGFWQNGRAVVLGWLGWEWPSLVTFARTCLAFYHNLWSIGWQVLGDFVADPLGFIYTRLEQAIKDRW